MFPLPQLLSAPTPPYPPNLLSFSLLKHTRAHTQIKTNKITYTHPKNKTEGNKQTNKKAHRKPKPKNCGVVCGAVTPGHGACPGMRT